MKQSRPPPGVRLAQIVALWESGELARAARESGTQARCAARLGMTLDALASALDQARHAGYPIPPFPELRRQPPDEWDDEPTQERRRPDMPDLCAPNIGMRTSTVQHVATAPATKAVDTPPASTVDETLAQRRTGTLIADLRARLKDALVEIEQLRLERDTAASASALHAEIPRIEPRETTSGLREATAVALASDWHIEERVDAAQVNGVNEYNLEIARRRVERFFAGLAYLVRYHQDHFKIRNLILWLGGDLITGYLRPENLESNELSPVQAIATLHVWIADGIRSLFETTDLEHGDVLCSSGNHGRLTDKVRPSTREANSIEWLLYAGLAREFAADPRVAFTLPSGSQTYADVYGFTIRFTHGDETKFGGGVGGIMIPLRKAIAKWQTVRHADLTCIGHYHQEHFLRDLIVNGSLIGYSPYSLAIAAPYEDPRQAFFLIDKHRGVNFPATIWVADRTESA